MNDYLDCLQHHGIKGQKWGVRRFQNPDGSLTARGRKRQSSNNESDKRKNSMKKKIAIGAAVTAGLIGTSFVVSKAIRSKASKDILDKGQKEANKLLAQAHMFYGYGASGTPARGYGQVMGAHYQTLSAKASSEANLKAYETSKSFSKSAKYLWDSRKKK